MTAKEKAWQAYCEAIMPTRRDYVYPLQGAFYKAFCAGYDAAQREPEPVADTESDVLTATYMLGLHAGKKAVTQRKPLTVEQLRGIREHQRLIEELGPVWAPMLYYFCQAIERAHGIGSEE